MEIKSFRIKNYRSIVDSGECYTSGDHITILAGKNEAGKTAILEALEDFTYNKKIRNDAIPLNSKEKPEISITFNISKKTLNNIFKAMDLDVSPNNNNNLQIIKRYPDMYSIDTDSLIRLQLRDDKIRREQEEEIENIYRRIQDLQKKYKLGGDLPPLDFSVPNNFVVRFKKFRTQIQQRLVNLNNKDINDLLKEFADKLSIVKSQTAHIDRFLRELLEKYIPNFILFSSFDDELPSEISLQQAKNNQLIKDLDSISNLNLELILSGTNPEKMRHKELLNIRMKDDYLQFWTQDAANLCADWDSEKLFLFIKEAGYFYPPRIRSKGKQWHLAFYIRVTARAREDVPNVILIDEPGLFLHASAQMDVIRKLEDSAKDSPIIFSTHSPYLIDVNNLNRIRLVIYDDVTTGTVIANKIHKRADKETLTPIITAIGLDLSIGLDIAKDNNIIVEGITDYYYLRAFIDLLKFRFKEDVHIIPSVGADKFSVLVSLMSGWGLRHCFVLDNDPKGKKVKVKLLKQFEHIGVKILSVSDDENNEIEDLFEKKDFRKYVLHEDGVEADKDKGNSQLVKQKGNTYDTVVLAKCFYEKINDIGNSLTSDTKKSFGDLLGKINELLFS